MAMPDIVLWESIAYKATIKLTAGTFNFTDWTDLKIISTALGLSKTLSGGDITNVGASTMTVTFAAADTTSKTNAHYPYQLLVKSGSTWYSVTGAQGTIEVRDAL